MDLYFRWSQAGWWRVGLYAGFCSGLSSGDGHPSRLAVTRPLLRPTRGGPPAVRQAAGGPPIPSARPCSGWGLSSRRSHPRRWCALTAPFHPYLFGSEEPSSAVCSLWHFPAGRPDWVLPSTLPCGVRTFLGRVTLRARTRPSGRLATVTIVTRGCLDALRAVPIADIWVLPNQQLNSLVTRADCGGTDCGPAPPTPGGCAQHGSYDHDELA